MAKLGAETVYNHADYRLLSKRVINELAQFKETNLYLVGLSRLSVLKVQAYIIQEANDLPESPTILSAKCHYLALNGITSLSVKPLRLVMSLGIIVSILSFIGVIWAVVDNLLGNTVTGWQVQYVSYASWAEYSLCASGLSGNTSGRYIWRSRIDPGLLSVRLRGNWKRKNDGKIL